MKAAAAMSGYTIDEIKAAKKAGCQAFRGARVYIDELDNFFQENPSVLHRSPEDRLDFEAKALKRASAQFDYDLKRGDYIHRGELADHLRKSEVETKSILRKFLYNELPAKGEQLDRASLRELTEEIFERICREKQEAFAKWM